jgi:hypothetical protein
MFAKRHDVADGRLKLFLGEFHLAGKIVQVANERRQYLAQARIFGALKLAQDRPGNVFLVLDDHS